MTPAFLISASFFVIAIIIFCVGRMMIGVRNRMPDSAARHPLALGSMTRAFAGVLPTGKVKQDKFKSQLNKAGFYGRHALDNFLAVRNAAVLSWIFFMLCVFAIVPEPGSDLTALIVVGVAVAAVLYTLPVVILGVQARNRVDRIKYALPDALDMVNMMVTGGLPLLRAIKRAASELEGSHADIACELAIVNHQASAGSLNQALQQFGQRIDDPDVVALSTLVQHADQLGGNVSVAFTDYADGVRRSRRQRAEERGNKASVMLLFPVILFLAPPIYILLLGPAVLEMRDFLVRQNQPGGVLDQTTRASAMDLLDEASQPPDAQSP